MKRRSEESAIEVPVEAKDELQPYADIFETIIIPLVRNLGDEEILLSHKTRQRLTERISNYCRKADIREPHPVLVFYGLMLCCYYCSGYESYPKLRPSKQSSALETIAKARALIRVTYYHLQHYKDSLFLCG